MHDYPRVGGDSYADVILLQIASASAMQIAHRMRKELIVHAPTQGGPGLWALAPTECIRPLSNDSTIHAHYLVIG